MAENAHPISPDKDSSPNHTSNAVPPPKEAQAHETTPIPPEILAKLPAQTRKEVLEVFSGSLSYTGPTRNPVLDKLTTQHISDLIGLAYKDRELGLEDHKDSRR